MIESGALFGDVKLPSYPGLESTCEPELIELTKAVDAAVLKRQETWNKKLRSALGTITSLEKEKSTLQEALKEKDRKIDALTSQIKLLELNKTQVMRKYEKELSELKSETRQKTQVRGCHKHGHQDSDDMAELKKTISKLQAQIQSLQNQVQSKDDRESSFKIEYMRLQQLIADLKTELLDKEKIIRDFHHDKKAMLEDIEKLQHKAKTGALVQRIDSAESLLGSTVETFMKGENLQYELLMQEITKEIHDLQTNLKDSAFVSTNWNDTS